jgi:hypothetical protein
VRAKELHAPGGMGGDELFQKQPAEQPWLRIGEHPVAQPQKFIVTLNLVAHCHKSSFGLARLIQWMRRKLMVRGGEY